MASVNFVNCDGGNVQVWVDLEDGTDNVFAVRGFNRSAHSVTIIASMMDRTKETKVTIPAGTNDEETLSIPVGRRFQLVQNSRGYWDGLFYLVIFPGE